MSHYNSNNEPPLQIFVVKSQEFTEIPAVPSSVETVNQINKNICTYNRTVFIAKVGWYTFYVFVQMIFYLSSFSRQRATVTKASE